MYSSKKVIVQYFMFLFLSNITNYCTTLQSITNAKHSATALFISYLAHWSISHNWSLRIKCSIPPDDQFHSRKDEIYRETYSWCLFCYCNLPSRLKHKYEHSFYHKNKTMAFIETYSTKKKVSDSHILDKLWISDM